MRRIIIEKNRCKSGLSFKKKAPKLEFKKLRLKTRLAQRLPNRVMKTLEDYEINYKQKLKKSQNISRNMRIKETKTLNIKKTLKLKYIPKKRKNSKIVIFQIN